MVFSKIAIIGAAISAFSAGNNGWSEPAGMALSFSNQNSYPVNNKKGFASKDKRASRKKRGRR
mgnify:CR=1 FL=1